MEEGGLPPEDWYKSGVCWKGPPEGGAKKREGQHNVIVTGFVRTKILKGVGEE